MAMILHSFFSLSVTTISGLRCSISLSVWIAKSQSILYLSFPALALVDAGPICLHIQPQILCTSQCKSQCTFFPSLSCFFLYWFPPRAEHELTIWVTFSIFSLQSCLGSTYKAFRFLFQLTCFQPLPPSLIFHPLCFSQELTLQCFLLPYCLSFILSFLFNPPINLRS